MSAFSIPNIQAHPESFIGPGLAGMFVQALQTGFLINQALRFWSRTYEPLILKVIVSFVSAVAAFQTAVSFYAIWRLCVHHFGDWVATVNPAWPDKIQTMLTMAMASPVQGFLIWRCWILTDKRWITLVPLSALLTLTTVTSIVVTADVFTVDFTKPLTPPAGPAAKIPVDVTWVLCISGAAILDIALTTILSLYLLRSRHSAITPRFKRIITKLIVIAWEAALLPSVCAITTVITYLKLVDYNFWDLFFQQVLGKFYVISLFVTLNGRADLQRKPQESFLANLTHITEMHPLSAQEIRIGIDRSRDQMHEERLVFEIGKLDADSRARELLTASPLLRFWYAARPGQYTVMDV
ncbi:hypothetical protein GLOTRDRAFT_140459 [Gloeophyllum trabeum ATCC 11539]|uniref:DUF6534 domain-containing protein n=1 Tax=Gloeophyllum trabeum (strain ATCC 11539 / FP-39264 / Madison 617) TaxID=670483 RepID=S7Q010_GLOTA|nr:uncharacterized protein GLOTRDRAFT_140459 [Gloeophyllum trabeum ATCC 11539]EPQ52867.1 hypothetical protein GLOTRDRAFT_140459 [Gloeophyllum trabeum ATCC 11539]